MTSLFVIDLIYTADPVEVERHLNDHRAFLERQYGAGMFLASGRKEPWTGGVILAAGNRSEILAVLEDDPFKEHGLAEYSVTEFLPTKTSSELGRYRHSA
ncbi:MULTISPECIES: YciI family protein [Arthrobacter]|uniref:GTP cyclohydrolase n=1 Tax=Arthrobacter terricola TaxID=2547396 RepID=A0A4R5K8D0_9MICC|nr:MULTISPECIES: YciI family protein [Arthrobacter]MBT8163263.1 GTP cyclohydrolase [Arthrobacter sp. GN70]TDF91179.1 GTP cyclohydrolase [Arthrobacter terricola]